MKKKLLSFLLAVLLIVTAFPQMIFAEEGQELVEPVETELVNDSNDSQNLEKYPTTYKATFYGNFEDSNYVETIEQTYYSFFKLPEKDPTRLGHKFAGWYTEKVGGIPVTEYTPVLYPSNLYAHWVKDTNAVAAIESYYVFEEEYRSVYYHYDNLIDALKDADSLDQVYLLKDVTVDEDIEIGENVFLNLNRHDLSLNGHDIVNNGTIIFYNREADYKLLKKIIYEEIEGCYAANEKLTVMYEGGKYIIPDGTFFTFFADEDPYCLDMDFAIFSDDDFLEWNGDVHPGSSLKVTYNLALGGDIIATKKEDKNKYADAHVVATVLKLNKDIHIGSNDVEESGASLFVRSMSGDDIGRIIPNDHKIVIKKTGKLMVTDGAIYDEGIIVSDVPGMVIEKNETTYEDDDELRKAYTYTLVEHRFTNEEYKIPHNYKGDLEFVTNGEFGDDDDVTVYIDDELLDSENYDLAHGSIHVILHNDFIKTLKAGSHTITIKAAGGYKTITQTFVIKSKPAPEPEHVIPKTGIDC